MAVRWHSQLQWKISYRWDGDWSQMETGVGGKDKRLIWEWEWGGKADIPKLLGGAEDWGWAGLSLIHSSPFYASFVYLCLLQCRPLNLIFVVVVKWSTSSLSGARHCELLNRPVYLKFWASVCTGKRCCGTFYLMLLCLSIKICANHYIHQHTSAYTPLRNTEMCRQL